MKLYADEVDCPCEWCRAHGQNVTGHRVVRYYFDVKPSEEALAYMDEIIEGILRDPLRGMEP